MTLEIGHRNRRDKKIKTLIRPFDPKHVAPTRPKNPQKCPKMGHLKHNQSHRYLGYKSCAYAVPIAIHDMYLSYVIVQ